MPILPPKVAKAIKQAKQNTVEKLVETAASQAGIGQKKSDPGREKIPAGTDPAQWIEKEKEKQKQLGIVRRHLQQLQQEQLSLAHQRQRQIEQEKNQAEAARQQIREKGLPPVPQISSKPKRGTALMGRRKKGKGSGELPAAQRSR
ncbi:MAG: hypothetical protein JW991_05240 [Candidatus Pacebacteria bacterium]|nr:hypothetical protein [Candidatus Paceibacterota bacterium]